MEKNIEEAPPPYISIESIDRSSSGIASSSWLGDGLLRLQDVAHSIQIPDLIKAIDIVVEIVHIVPKIRHHKEAFKRLAREAMEIVDTISGVLVAVQSPELIVKLKPLVSDLENIKCDAEKMAGRSTWFGIIPSRTDAETIADHHRRLQRAMDVFIIHSKIKLDAGVDRGASHSDVFVGTSRTEEPPVTQKPKFTEEECLRESKRQEGLKRQEAEQRRVREERERLKVQRQEEQDRGRRAEADSSRSSTNTSRRSGHMRSTSHTTSGTRVYYNGIRLSDDMFGDSFEFFSQAEPTATGRRSDRRPAGTSRSSAWNRSAPEIQCHMLGMEAGLAGLRAAERAMENASIQVERVMRCNAHSSTPGIHVSTSGGGGFPLGMNGVFSGINVITSDGGGQFVEVNSGRNSSTTILSNVGNDYGVRINQYY